MTDPRAARVEVDWWQEGEVPTSVYESRQEQV